MISAFYYARTMDFSKAKEGDIFTINVFYDNTNFPLKIKYKGKERKGNRSFHLQFLHRGIFVPC